MFLTGNSIWEKKADRASTFRDTPRDAACGYAVLKANAP